MSIASLFQIALKQTVSSQSLQREPEPVAVTDQIEHVEQYDQVMTTKLAISYAILQEMIHRWRNPLPSDSSAMDLACGPGHLTVALAKNLGYQKISGVDLSPRMIKVAEQNALQQLGKPHSFSVGDITDLKSIPSESFDLVSFADAAHHMPNLETITVILQNMNRIVKKDGLVVLMDLVRLKSTAITDSYVMAMASDYKERGLPHFFKDFRDSMFAAWTESEMISAIPKSNSRTWFHFGPRLFPSMQFVVGLPEGRKELFNRESSLWNGASVPVPSSMKMEWRLANLDLLLGKTTRVAN